MKEFYNKKYRIEADVTSIRNTLVKMASARRVVAHGRVVESKLKFELYLIQGRVNSFLPVLSGTMIFDGDILIVSACFDLHIYVRILIILSYIFVVFFTLVSMLLLGFTLDALTPLLTGVFVYSLTQVGVRSSKKQKETLVEFVDEVFTRIGAKEM